MAEDVANLVVQVALENSNFQKNIQAMNRQIRAATAEFKNSTSGLDKYGKGLDGLESKSKMLSKQVDAQSKILTEYRNRLSESKRTLEDNANAQVRVKEKLENLTKEYEKSIEMTGKNSDESKKLKEQIDELTKEYDKNEEKIRNNVSTMENWEIKTNNAERKLKDMEQSLKDTSKEIEVQSSKWTQLGDELKELEGRLDKLGDKMQETGRGLSKKLTAPIMAINGIAAKLGIGFEKSMSEVQAVTGATAEEMEQLEKAAREAGATTDKSARDAADALKYMALAGWDVEDSQKALMPVLKLSSAAGIGLGKASDLVTNSMASMGVSIDELGEYLDKISYTQANAATETDEMMEAYIKAGGMFNQLNVEMDESAALLGILANRGLKGAEAGNSLNSVMVNLSGSTDKTREIFDELGIAIYDQDGSYIGLESTLVKLKEKFDGMSDSEKNYYMAQLVGKTQIDTMTKLLGGLGDEYYNLKGEISEANGSLDDMYNIATDNTMGAINNLKSGLEELGLKIFDIVSPAMTDLIEKVQGVVDWLNNLSPEMQETIVKIAGVVAAIGPALLIGGKLTSGIGNIAGKVAGLSLKIGEAGGAMAVLKTKIAALTGPIGIAVAAISAMIAITVYLYKTNEEFRNKVQEIWSDVKEIISSVIEIVSGVIKTFVNRATELWDIYGEDILAITKTIWNTIAKVIRNLTKIISGVLDIFIGAFTGDWDKFTGGLEKIWQGTWNALRDIVSGAWNLLKGAFELLKTSITEWFTGLVKNFIEFGKNLIIGLGEGIIATKDWVVEKVKEVGTGISNTVKKAFGIHSPSKLMYGYGENIAEGLGLGIIENKDIAEDAGEELGQSFIDGLDKSDLEEWKNKQIKAVDDLHKSLTSALKKKYEEEGKVREDALNKEIKDLDEWKNESLKRINSVYDEKIKKIDESSNRQIKALEEELKALDKSEQERSREEVEDEYKSDIDKLEDALQYEHDEYNKQQIQKEIDRRKKEHEKQLNEWSVEDKKAALNKQIEDIRENAEMEKEILEGKRLEELERIDNLYDFERDVLESKMEDHREYLQQKTDDAQLQAEAEKMIVYNQQEDILDILKQYEPHYEYAGHSLGQRVFDGAKPQLSKLVSMINSIYSTLGVDPIRVSDFQSYTKKYDTRPAEIQYNRRYAEELFDKDFALPNKKVEYNVNITSPKALNAAEQRRAMNRELKKLSFEVV